MKCKQKSTIAIAAGAVGVKMVMLWRMACLIDSTRIGVWSIFIMLIFGQFSCLHFLNKFARIKIAFFISFYTNYILIFLD